MNNSTSTRLRLSLTGQSALLLVVAVASSACGAQDADPTPTASANQGGSGGSGGGNAGSGASGGVATPPETWWICGSTAEIGFSTFCRFEECGLGAWPEAGPFSSSDSCIDARPDIVEHIKAEGHAGGARFDFDEIGTQSSLVWRSTDSGSDIATELIGATITLLPDNQGLIVAWGTPDTVGSTSDPGPGWLAAAFRGDAVPGSLTGLPTLPEWLGPSATGLQPGTARVFFDELAAQVTGPFRLERNNQVFSDDQVQLDLEMDLSGLELITSNGDTFVAEGIVSATGSTNLNEIQPGDGGAGSSGGAGGSGGSGGSSGGGDINPGYDHPVLCDTPGSTTVQVPISPGTTVCQKAMEFFAETYSCNHIDDFDAATQRVCNACGSNSPVPCP